jgi:hypothetical protein
LFDAALAKILLIDPDFPIEATGLAIVKEQKNLFEIPLYSNFMTNKSGSIQPVTVSGAKTPFIFQMRVQSALPPACPVQ